MNGQCPNQHCRCENCECTLPCTCGLRLVTRTTTEVWTDDEFRHTVTSYFEPAPDDGLINDGDTGNKHAHSNQHAEPIAGIDDALKSSHPDFDRRTNVLDHYGQAADAHGAQHDQPSVRRATHAGHEIEIRTHYEVRINGDHLDAHLGVNDDGTVHYHGLPNYSSSSAIDLMRQLVDAFPDDYPPAVSEEAG